MKSCAPPISIVALADIYRIVNDRIAENRHLEDNLSYCSNSRQAAV